jgi:Rieske Fe-S protein
MNENHTETVRNVRIAGAADMFKSAMMVGRRKLLLIGGGAVCAQALGCGPETFRVLPVLIPAGNVADLPQGTLRAVDGMGAAIGRDTGGIYAMSLICTHAGCDISVDGSVSAGSVQCFCHGSVFDGQGNPLRGPARSALSHLVVTIDAQRNLTIHGDETTSPATRLPA